MRSQLTQVESSLQVRQMGLGEQIRSIREEIARVESKIDENHRGIGNLAQQLEVVQFEMQESLVQLDHSVNNRFKVTDENIARLHKGIEDLQGNTRTLSENLRTMSEFEKSQEERIGQMRDNLQKQLDVVVEEVGRENSRLQGEIAELSKDVFHFQELINTVDGEMRKLASRIQSVSRRQEELARSGRTAPGGNEHVVRRGETLSLIAGQYGVTVEAIMSANGLANANLIQEGQSLTIPVP